MVAGLSKRQQARNEKALQDLVRSIPGNDRCADCQAYNPGWASWNLGVFLCMRCAALHRKLGTHVSKVKSLTMDTWTAEQVDNMKSHGNTIVNQIYNPKNVKPPVPIDIDEADSAMARFIRQKYEQRSLEDGKPKPPSRHDSGYTRSPNRYDSSYTRSPEGSPPPPPPKTGKLFGFGLRSSSSHSHLPRSSGRWSSNQTSPRSPTFGSRSHTFGPRSPTYGSRSHTFSPRSPTYGSRSDTFGPRSPTYGSRSPTYGSRSPPFSTNKQSRVFGASVGETSASFEQKLSILKDMGFPDDRRNATVLKGLSGNLEKTIESLSRLGEGSHHGSRARTPGLKSTPTGAHFGVSFPSPKAADSTNPFDQLDAKAEASGHSTAAKSYNPFDALDTQSTSTVENSFQNLQVSRPLFPHSTGGYPSRHGQDQTFFQHPMTPPVIMPSSHSQFVASPQPLNGNYNPFFQSVPQPQSNVSNPYASQPQNLPQGNPFFSQVLLQNTSAQPQLQAQQSLGSSFQVQDQSSQPQYTGTVSSFGSLPQSQPQQLEPQQLQPQQQPQQGQFSSSHNPFGSMTATANAANPYSQQQMPQMQQQTNFQSQPQYLTPQQTGRVDKNAILSLYNIPPPVPPVNAQFQQQQQQIPQQPTQSLSTPGFSPAPSLLTNSIGSTPQTQSSFNLSTPQRSVTMPVSFQSPSAGAGNPFFTSSPFGGQMNPAVNPTATSAAPSGLGIGMGARTHVSQESVDISGLQNGRHSPDAFANLSARYV